MPDVTAYRPLEHFQKVELMLELKLREGPSWILSELRLSPGWQRRTAMP
ncbi:hypothetical protein [Pseudomonas aeruginosa]